MAADATTPPVDLLNSKAWDDRELINAYDAALLEFHLHNPGPGSWLDKATAALAQGQPLPGANAFGTTWYTAARPPAPAISTAANPGASGHESTDRPSKRARNGPAKSVNPYSSARPSGPALQKGGASPVYSPPSPGAGPSRSEEEGSKVVDEMEELGGGDDEEYEGYEEEQWEGYDGDEGAEAAHYEYPPYAHADGGEGAWGGAGDEAEGYIFPPPSGQWPAGGSQAVSHDDAVGFALHAQYWAGYWIGVANGARQAEAAAIAIAAQTQSRNKTNQNSKGRASKSTTFLRR